MCYSYEEIVELVKEVEKLELLNLLKLKRFIKVEIDKKLEL